MRLHHLQLQGFRNLHSQKIEFQPELNFFYGANGAGKTSILEAIQVLANGKSFRQAQLRQCLQREANAFLLQAAWQMDEQVPYSAGVQWQQGQWTRRMNQQPQAHHLDIARKFPCMSLHPGTHLLVAAGPEARRKLLNWLMFHVEPAFLSAWKQFELARAQRNALLRQQRKGWELEEWSRTFLDCAQALNRVQEKTFTRYLSHFHQRMSRHPSLCNLDLHFHPGWSAQLSLEASLERNLDRDLEQGHTQAGPHRMDLRLRLDGRDAREWLSRGQQKLVAYEMVLAATALLAEQNGQWPLLLLDDLQAELDLESLSRMLQPLRESQCQIIANGLHPECLRELWPEMRMFHVEQGRVEPSV